MQKREDNANQGCGCGCGCGEEASLPVSRLPDWASAPDDALVCHCGKVDKAAIKNAVQMGAYTIPLVKIMTGACRGNDCETLNPLGRSCAADIQELIRLYHQGPPDFITKSSCSC